MNAATQRDGAPTRHRVDFLAGVRVLELGDGVAGACATALLRALGADVTTVVDATSPHRRGRPRTTGGTSLLAACLARDKTLLTADDLAPLDDLVADGFDLVVVDRVLGARGPLAALATTRDHVGFVGRHRGTAWLTISAFGLSGPRADDTATELGVAAAGGMLSAVRDEATGRPLKLGGQQCLLNTGQAGALAACHALDLRLHGAGPPGTDVADLGDVPVHLDLRAVEATLAMGPVLEVGGELLDTGAPGGAKRYGAPASFYRCSDGLVRISAMEDHQWRGVVTAMGSPPWADRFATVASRVESADEVDEHVAAWAATRTKADAEAVLQANGVPATAVYSPEEILASPQLAHRESFETLSLADGHDATVVGLPFRIVDSGAGRPGRRHRSVRGLRVLEASQVLAVPLGGALLAAMGAEVTKLEDLGRLDMYRRRGPWIEGEEHIERSAYFALMNHSKSSEAFDVDTVPQRLEALLDDTDVVIENLGRKRASALRVGAWTARSAHPDLLAVSSSGFGHDGPLADYRAYAYNLQASGALGYLTRTPDGENAEIDIAWADLVSAYALATIVAAWAVGPAGNAGAGIDFSMTDLVVSHFNEYLAAASLGVDDADVANELEPYAPHGVFATSQGWLALAVDGDAQFRALGEVLTEVHGDATLRGERWARAQTRLAHREELESLVEDATATCDGHALAAALRARGVDAEVVAGAEALVADDHLDARGIFGPVDHPVWGRRRLVGVPWRPHGGPALALAAPPLLERDDADAP